MIVFSQLANAQFNTDWPNYMGPNWNFTSNTAKNIGYKGDQYRLMWISEDPVPGMKAQSKRYGGTGTDTYLGGGGGASPILAEGKLYVYYAVPSGKVWMKEQFLERDSSGKFIPRYWSINADEIITCIDTATGKTIWRTILPQQGYNFYENKGLYSSSPCYGDGKVFINTTMGKVIALNASTGAIVWQSNVGSFTTKMANNKAQSLATEDIVYMPLREHLLSSVYLWGKVIVPDFVGTNNIKYRVFNGATGAFEWQVNETMDDRSNFRAYTYNGKTFLVMANPNGVKAFDSTGAQVWALSASEAISDGDMAIIGKDYSTGKVYGTFQKQVGNNVIPVCYQLSDSLPVFKWEKPTYNLVGKTPRILPTFDGYWYLPTANGTYKVKMDDGTVQSSYLISDAATETHQQVHNDVILREMDSQHSNNSTTIWRVQPFGLSSTGWLVSEIAHETAYQKAASHPIVNGKLYRRTAFGIACYSLIEDTIKSFDVNLHYPRTNYAHSKFAGEPIVKPIGDSVMLRATVTGSVQKVEYYFDGVKVGETFAEPHQFQINNLTLGTHTAYTLGYNAQGLVRKSVTRLVLVRTLDYVEQYKDTIMMRVGQKRYIYPMAFDNRGDRMPPYLQNYVNTVPTGGTFVGNQFIPNKAGTFTVTSSVTFGGVTKSDTMLVYVTKRTPKLTFPHIASQFLSSNAFIKLGAFMSDNLTPSYELVSGAATLSNDTLYFNSTGSITIKAFRVADSANNAVEQSRTFNVYSAPIISKINISPNNVTISNFENQLFSATVLDQGGLSFATQPNITWFTPSGNTINDLGFFFAQTIGVTYIYCTATVGGVSRTDSVMVTVVPFRRVVSVAFGDNTVSFPGGETAGVIPAINWNLMNSTTASPLLDNFGKFLPLSVTQSGFGGNYKNTTITITDGNSRLMSFVRGRNSSSAASTLSISGIPLSLRTNPYKVYAYWKNHENTSKTQSFEINGQGLFLNQNTATWDGQFIQSTANNAASAPLGSNYVVFDNITDSNLVITVKPNLGIKYGISGLQLEFFDVNPPVKNPQIILNNNVPNPFYLGNSINLQGATVSGGQIYYYVTQGKAYANGSTITPTDTGWVTVKLYTPGNVFWQSAEKTVSFYVQYLPTQVVEVAIKPSFNFYPNPTNGNINVDYVGSSKGSLQIYDFTGRLILSKQIEHSAGSTEVDLSDLVSGSYLLRFVSDGLIERKIIIKQ